MSVNRNTLACIPKARYPVLYLLHFGDALTQNGIHNVYFESPGTAHEWLTLRRYLYDFAPRLFR